MHRLADASAVHLPSACMSSACMSSRGIVDHLATTVHRHAASPSRPYIGKTARESAGASSMSPRRSSRPQSCIQLVTSVSAQKMEGGSGPAGSEEPARRKRAGGGLKDGGSIDREAGSGKVPGSRRLRPAPCPRTCPRPAPYPSAAGHNRNAIWDRHHSVSYGRYPGTQWLPGLQLSPRNADSFSCAATIDRGLIFLLRKIVLFLRTCVPITKE